MKTDGSRLAAKIDNEYRLENSYKKKKLKEKAEKEMNELVNKIISEQRK